LPSGPCRAGCATHRGSLSARSTPTGRPHRGLRAGGSADVPCVLLRPCCVAWSLPAPGWASLQRGLSLSVYVCFAGCEAMHARQARVPADGGQAQASCWLGSGAYREGQSRCCGPLRGVMGWLFFFFFLLPLFLRHSGCSRAAALMRAVDLMHGSPPCLSPLPLPSVNSATSVRRCVRIPSCAHVPFLTKVVVDSRLSSFLAALSS
jgi:hypothetical protein